jgi:prepilin-type processing-associated H-X9-DG protein
MARATSAHPLPATTPTTAPATSATLTADVPGPHLSYTYLGRGLTPDVPEAPRIVLLYEPPALHGGGMNALFADGHVQFIPAPEAVRMVAQLERGTNPPAPADAH